MSLEEGLLAGVLAVLVLQNVPRAWDWLRRHGRLWGKRWRNRTPRRRRTA
jgi:hypothetical protein